MESSFGVRKGAWSEEEDVLLRQSIESYGEGKWHQIPTKAGLNRCRKSCRLRWLNYLKPNIKRGDFEVDEIDLIIRLHKLLGNRWSLIAGRLPGRTSNDVKNYWNTHLRKKVIPCTKNMKKKKAEDMVKVNIVKPQPYTPKNLPWLSQKAIVNIQPQDTLSKPSPILMPSENNTNWWDDFFNGNESFERFMCTTTEVEGEPMTNLWTEEIETTINFGDTFVGEGSRCWTESDFYFEVNLWDSNAEQHATL